MSSQSVRVQVSEPLRFLLSSRYRQGDAIISTEDGAPVGHIVESLGIPRTEIGQLRVNAELARFDTRSQNGDSIEVSEIVRPQKVTTYRFLLDVHLGTLARRMRLLGIDTDYSNDADDPELVAEATSQNRILLTQDRGLLRRRALVWGAYVYGSDPDEQLLDVLDRFDPPMLPWSRCPMCNGILENVGKSQIAHLLEPGTLRSYSEFAQCRSCERPYWRGAHAGRLDTIIAEADRRRRACASTTIFVREDQ